MNLLFQEIFDKFPAESKNHIVINNEKACDGDALIGNILEKLHEATSLAEVTR